MVSLKYCKPRSNDTIMWRPSNSKRPSNVQNTLAISVTWIPLKTADSSGSSGLLPAKQLYDLSGSGAESAANPRFVGAPERIPSFHNRKDTNHTPGPMNRSYLKPFRNHPHLPLQRKPWAENTKTKPLKVAAIYLLIHLKKTPETPLSFPTARHEGLWAQKAVVAADFQFVPTPQRKKGLQPKRTHVCLRVTTCAGVQCWSNHHVDR